MKAVNFMYVFLLNYFCLFNIWSFIDLEDISRIIIKDINSSFKILLINFRLKIVKEVAHLSIHHNVIWCYDNKNVFILKDIIFLMNRDMIVLQTHSKKLKDLNACTQCLNELDSFACCVIDDFVSLLLNLDTCVNC